MEYKATLIRLPKKTLDALKLRAVKKRTSLAQLVRDAIAETYRIGVEDEPLDLKKDPFYKTIGMCRSGITDGSVRHDRDIYGVDD